MSLSLEKRIRKTRRLNCTHIYIVYSHPFIDDADVVNGIVHVSVRKTFLWSTEKCMPDEIDSNTTTKKQHHKRAIQRQNGDVLQMWGCIINISEWHFIVIFCWIDRILLLQKKMYTLEGMGVGYDEKCANPRLKWNFTFLMIISAIYLHEFKMELSWERITVILKCGREKERHAS